MTEPSSLASTRYRIGAVSRLTGISPDTLRIWERRYGAVSPQRSPRGGRLYSPQDLERLRLMKQLVDAGDAIGEVANLDTEALQERAKEARQTPPALGQLTEAAPCRVVIVGESLAPSVGAARDGLTGIELVATFSDSAAFEAQAGDIQSDVLIIEQATLHEDTAARLLDYARRTKARHAVVVYRFASNQSLSRLPASRCSALRAPVNPHTLETHCLAVMRGTAARPVPTAADGAPTAQPAPPRRYDDERLARLATLSTTVKCECPRHLAELISGLSAFERYSSECESRNSRDAALHAYLYATASQARHMIEDALDHVIELEGIKI